MPESSRYRIIERIDAGGMAEVFKGVAESLQGFRKNVAIKRILPNLTRNKKFVAMFLDEARLSLHLNHANIVQVFDIGVADNTYFIVMEYVESVNLRTLLDSLRRRQQRMRLAHSVYILQEVCKGLAYAHEMADPETGRPLGIVHRDISPPNILLSVTGEVKLVDFGLAKATSQIEQTDPGVVKGKFSYLSPEAANGIEVDYRADVFAAGIILYEMLAGRRLFQGDSDFQTVELVRQAKVPPLRPLNHEVDGELERIVLRALARDPRDRYQHAQDLSEHLTQYLFSRGLKVTARDLAHLVREVIRSKSRGASPRPARREIIDSLIQEEIVKFTSLDHVSEDSHAGAAPLSPDDLRGGAAALAPEEFIDPRRWAAEAGGSALLPQIQTGQRSGQSAGEHPDQAAGERTSPRILPRQQGSESLSRMRVATRPELAAALEGAPPVMPAPALSIPRRRRLGLILAIVLLLIAGLAAAALLLPTARRSQVMPGSRPAVCDPVSGAQPARGGIGMAARAGAPAHPA